MNAPAPSLSLILATYGRTDELARVVDSLAAQTCRDFELLVVDQNPDQRVRPFIEQAERAGLEVRHLRLDRPSLSGARNLGIAQARGLVAGFPDDDCWYEPDTVAQVLACLRAQAGWQGLVVQWVEQCEGTGVSLPGRELELQRWRQFRDGYASSITLFVRTALLRDLGGFDTRFGVGQWFGAGEETDLVLSALSRGARLGRCPQARVHHRFAGSQQPAPPWRSVMQRERACGALYVKHGLPLPVVLRGLVAPPVNALLGRAGGGLAAGLAASLGRAQGAWAWWRQARAGE